MRKRNRGQSLDINAGDWNRVCDLANQKIGQTAANGGRLPPNCVYVRNTLGRDLTRFAAVCIGFPTPAELHTGANDQVFSLVNGSLLGRRSSFYAGGEIVVGVLPEPIANGRIGFAQIAGVTPAQFRTGELIPTAGAVPDFATISDLDDMLVGAQFGPVRLLHRNFSMSGSWTSDRYWWVLLGTAAPSLGSVRLRGEWDGNYINCTWNELVGDRRALGFYSEDGEIGPYPAGHRLRLCRPGRYRVVVRFSVGANAPSGGFLTGDRLEWRARWFDTHSGVGDPAHKFGSATPSAWAEGQPIADERSFHITIDDPAATTPIPLPLVEAKRIAFATGASTSLTIGGGGKIEVEVVCIGARAFYTFWSKAARDTAVARGASAGPV